jgi:DNA-binding transcriptional MerR regulator
MTATVDSDLFPIAELGRRTGFTPATLRYYEKIGLLDAPPRSEAGYRLYGRDAEARLQFIRRAKQLGLSLDEIRELVTFWARGECATTRARIAGLVGEKIAEVREQIEESSTFLRQLELVAERLDDEPDPASDGCACAPQLPHVDRVHLDADLSLVTSSACTCGGACAAEGCGCGCACCGAGGPSPSR